VTATQQAVPKTRARSRGSSSFPPARTASGGRGDDAFAAAASYLPRSTRKQARASEPGSVPRLPPHAFHAPHAPAGAPETRSLCRIDPSRLPAAPQHVARRERSARPRRAGCFRHQARPGRPVPYAPMDHGPRAGVQVAATTAGSRERTAKLCRKSGRCGYVNPTAT
jgi:hypothetical protein